MDTRGRGLATGWLVLVSEAGDGEGMGLEAQKHAGQRRGQWHGLMATAPHPGGWEAANRGSPGDSGTFPARAHHRGPHHAALACLEAVPPGHRGRLHPFPGKHRLL